MIRPAGPPDASAIAEAERRATEAPWSPTQVCGSLALDSTGAWVDEQAGEVVGYLLVSAQGEVGEVLILGVLPEARRQGRGAALLACATDWWTARGVLEAFLEVRADNGGALALYAGCGWQRVGTRRRYYSDGADALALRLTIRA